MKFNQTLSHQTNSALANKGQLITHDNHHLTRCNVTLEQNDLGKWLVRINGGCPLMATDVEVELWLELQKARAK